jgi:hypothetical protein
MDDLAASRRAALIKQAKRVAKPLVGNFQLFLR